MRISDWSADVCSSCQLRDRPASHGRWRHVLDLVPYQGGHLQLSLAGVVGHRQPCYRSVRGRHHLAYRRRHEECPSVRTYLYALASSRKGETVRSEEHTSELQSLMRISYA